MHNGSFLLSSKLPPFLVVMPCQRVEKHKERVDSVESGVSLSLVSSGFSLHTADREGETSEEKIKLSCLDFQTGLGEVNLLTR